MRIWIAIVGLLTVGVVGLGCAAGEVTESDVETWANEGRDPGDTPPETIQ